MKIVAGIVALLLIICASFVAVYGASIGGTDSGGIVLKVTNVNAATYDLLTSDYYLHVTYTATGAVTSLTLPTAQCNDSGDNGRQVYIKDGAGNAGQYNITIDTEGSEDIDGEDAYFITANYNDVGLYCYSSNWYITD